MDNPIKILQDLPNLKYLRLDCGYKGKEMRFESGGFQKLKKLSLTALCKLNTMIIDKGAMPVLEKSDIGLCRQLKEVPLGIQYLKDLKVLFFLGMSNEFTERLSRDGGKDYWIVKHIPIFQYDGTHDPEDAARLQQFADAYEVLFATRTIPAPK